MTRTNLSLTVEGADKLSAMAAVLTPALFAKALQGGVSYAAKATPPAISKAVVLRYNIKAAAVKDDISKPTFADGGTTVSFGLSRRPRTAAAFGGREIKAGYSFAVIKNERQLFRRGFLGTFNGTELPFSRTGQPKRVMRAGRYAGKMREPIDVIHGVSLGSVFMGDARFADEMQAEVGARIGQQFITGVDREFKRAGRGF